MKADTQERPDFEKAAIEKFISDVTDPRSREQFESRKRIEELEAVLNSIRGSLYNRDADDAILHEIEETLTENGFPWEPED